MTLREILGRLTAWRRRPELEQELAAELDDHLARLARDHEASGLSPADARAAARRQLGNLTTLREESRRAWGFPLAESILRDLRYGLRGLARSPGFTISVVLTLGLGIGANAAIFAVLDRLMFRPHPMLHDPSSVRRVYLQTTNPQGQRRSDTVFPYQRYLDLAADSTPFSAIAAVSEWRFAVGSGDAVRIRKVAGVSASLFSFFDAPPAAGRYFVADEDVTPRGTDVAVISHALWRSDFGGGPVVGTRLKVGRIEYTIIGVAPAGFVGTVSTSAPDVFVPVTTIPANLGAWPEEPYLGNYRMSWVEMLVRLAPGVAPEQADVVLTQSHIRSRTAARALNPRVLPDSIARPVALAGAVKTAAGPSPGTEAKVLLWVSGVAMIVLVIACASVVNLMLARLARRRREVTVRLALGVSRLRLIGQFATESLLLAVLAATGGLLAAQWSGAAIRGMLLPEGTPFMLWKDGRTIAFVVGCAVLCAALTTLGPAWMLRRTDLADSLRGGAREAGGRRSRLQSSLLVLQVSLSVVLLVGASLFVRSFANAREVPLGYDASPVIEVILDYRGNAVDDVARARTRQRIEEAALAIPGVEAIAAVNSRLFATNSQALKVDGVDSVEALGRFNSQVTTPSYFQVMRTRILRGRGLEDGDRAGALPVVVVSEAMGRAIWPDKDPLGQCIRIGIDRFQPIESAPCHTVVGIAENSAQQELADEQRFMYYLPYDYFPLFRAGMFYVRTRGTDVTAMLEPIRRELTRVMPGDGLVVVRPLQEIVDNQMRSWRLGATLFLTLGGLAFVVAAVGLYGVISFGVAGRINEIGVRIALGASPGRVIALVVRDGLGIALVGSAAGLLIAWSAARWLEPLLFQQPARDPGVFAVVLALVAAVALLASAIPARRATKVDPMQALRVE